MSSERLELRGYNAVTWGPDVKIIAIGWPNNNDMLRVGKGIINITAYSEQGEMANVIWFEAEWPNGTIRRYNGSMVKVVEIEYI